MTAQSLLGKHIYIAKRKKKCTMCAKHLVTVSQSSLAISLEFWNITFNHSNECHIFKMGSPFLLNAN